MRMLWLWLIHRSMRQPVRNPSRRLAEGYLGWGLSSYHVIIVLLHLPSLLFKFGTNCRTRQGWSRLILIFCSTHRRSDDDEDDDSPPHRSSCRDFGTDFVWLLQLLAAIDFNWCIDCLLLLLLLSFASCVSLLHCTLRIRVWLCFPMLVCMCMCVFICCEFHWLTIITRFHAHNHSFNSQHLNFFDFGSIFDIRILLV